MNNSINLKVSIDIENMLDQELIELCRKIIIEFEHRLELIADEE